MKQPPDPSEDSGLYILLISIHGLIRGKDLELGRDSDTGGQTKYVIELARALAEKPEVGRVELLTRQVIDRRVDADYAEPMEDLPGGARIVRLPCGPRRYLRKEVLWPHLDSFADQALQHLRRVGKLPDVIHAHYADAGYVGTQLSSLLGIPLVFTGHSLGRDKLRRLKDKGTKEKSIESQYHISQRIEAEELTLENSALVVASTRQEIEEQYEVYDNYQPERMVVIPPGIDISRFHPPRRQVQPLPFREELERFLRNPRKPMILALSRPDERKNIATLIRAYGENPRLRDLANLVIIAGNRDAIAHMDKGPRKVLVSILALIDGYDLYGSVAYPKHHHADDVPYIYQIAAQTHGVFVNPALTEPFGLTLIEAAASGLPVVATHDGGPAEITRLCDNGLLVDPLDPHAMSAALLEALSDKPRWKRWSRNGLRGAHAHFSWPGHADNYLRNIRKLLVPPARRRNLAPARNRLPTVDRMLVCDIDGTLIGDKEGLAILLDHLKSMDHRVGFGVATGRRVESALSVLHKWNVPTPDLLITSVGSKIFYGHQLVEDATWRGHIEYRWEPEAIRKVLKQMPGLKLQPREDQRHHKISYFIEPVKAPSVREIVHHLRRLNLHARVIYSHEAYLDLLPIRASKGHAMRYLGMKWGLPPERFLVAGDSGNDDEMLSGDTLGVVVGNYSPELEGLRGRPRIYFADDSYAKGIVEGMMYYDFLGSIRIPEEEIKMDETKIA